MKRSAVGAEEHAFVAEYAFQPAQVFNPFYHHHHILTENDRTRKRFLLQLSRLVEFQVVAALALLGIESPEKKYRSAARLESCYDSVVV
jgi:arginyl-tRNA synthetase